MIYKDLPPIARKLVLVHDAWIVGSAANIEVITPKDVDILVPFREWCKAAALIPVNATVNTFGGWKFLNDLVVIDVWPGELGITLSSNLTKYAWHPASNTRIIKQ